jgi:hypothetical protein
MENIKNRTLYINITTQNKQHEVREARLVTLISTFESINFRGSLLETNPIISYVNPTELRLEIAGMGVLGKSQIDALYGVLYLTEEDACTQTSYYIYSHKYSDFNLKWADIALNDLSLRNNKFSIVKDCDKSYHNYYAKSWCWNGTKACGKYFARRFQFDFANNISVEYSDIENDKFNQQKLYATKEMCENDNKPTIVRFDNKPKQVEKIVTFEITTKVMVNVNNVPECEEKDAIIKAMNNVRACDDEVLFDACISCTDYPIR